MQVNLQIFFLQPDKYRKAQVFLYLPSVVTCVVTTAQAHVSDTLAKM